MKLKFKILPKVDGFRDARGVLHLPGDIVDLPESYLGETWLKKHEPTEKTKPTTPTSNAQATTEAVPEAPKVTPETALPIVSVTERKKPTKKTKPKPASME